jgi:hypothetical protein
MIVCEYLFKAFYTRGSEEYLDTWAMEVDLLAEEGWKVLDCCRQAQGRGFWTLILARPAHLFGRESVEGRFAEEGN